MRLILSMLQITQRDVEDSFGHAVRHMSGYRERGDRALHGLVHRGAVTASVLAGSTLTGLAIGYLGPDRLNIPNTSVPAHAVLGVLGHAAGLTGIYGGYSDYAHAFWDGMLGLAAGTWAVGKGQLMAERKGIFSGEKKRASLWSQKSRTSGPLGGRPPGPPPLMSPSPSWEGPRVPGAEPGPGGEYTEAELAAMALG